MMDLRALVEKSADADLLREMIGFATERLMEQEVGAKTRADYGEKSSDRLAKRNGYRDRDWQTRAGNVELRIPRLQTGSNFPPFLEPWRSVEKALTAVISEAYVLGFSTCAMDDLVQAMGWTGIEVPPENWTLMVWMPHPHRPALWQAVEVVPIGRRSGPRISRMSSPRRTARACRSSTNRSATGTGRRARI
jgi:hypothetical protein